MSEAPSQLEAVVAELAEQISHLGPGDRAPSEAEITSRIGIPRSRARQIVMALEAGHLVQRRQGAGTFATKVYEYVVADGGGASLHRTISSLGGSVRTATVDMRDDVAPPVVAAAFDLEPGTRVPVITRVGHVDGRPAAHLREYLAPEVLDEMGIALRVIESVEEILCAAGFEPYRAACRGTIAIPPLEVWSRLRTTPAQQVWRVESVLRDRATGRVLLASDNHVRMDVVRMVFVHGDRPGEMNPG